MAIVAQYSDGGGEPSWSSGCWPSAPSPSSRGHRLEQGPQRCGVLGIVRMDLGFASPERVRRLVDDFVPERHIQPHEFDSLPTTLSTRVGYTTAEGLRNEIE